MRTLLLSKIQGKVNLKIVLEVVGIILLLGLMFYGLNWLGLYLQEEQVKLWIEHSGPFSIFIYSLIYLTSIVIAPVPGFFAYVITVGIYGVWKIVLFSYFLAMIGATVNFLIARHLGRPIMKKLIGHRGVLKVEKHTEKFGTEVLILTRLFDGFLFEWISYAAGLTNMSFKTYIIITAWASIPYHILLFVFSTIIPELGQMFIVLSVVNYALLGVPVIYYFFKHRLMRL